jgi:hypothetical protein
MIARAALTEQPEPPYGIVVFGDGARIESSIRYLATIETPVEAIDYVGDLDGDGLRIALSARRRAVAAGLPEPAPASALHRAMPAAAAELGHAEGWPGEVKRREQGAVSSVEFLAPELRPAVAAMLRVGRRVPEEVLAPERLRALFCRRERPGAAGAFGLPDLHVVGGDGGTPVDAASGDRRLAARDGAAASTDASSADARHV